MVDISKISTEQRNENTKNIVEAEEQNTSDTETNNIEAKNSETPNISEHSNLS